MELGVKVIDCLFLRQQHTAENLSERARDLLRFEDGEMQLISKKYRGRSELQVSRQELHELRALA